MASWLDQGRITRRIAVSAPASGLAGPPGLRVAGTVRRGTFDITVDLDVAPGEVLALVGPNGAGKTSILRALAGLEPLRHGRIELAGQVLADAGGTHIATEKRAIGVVFQDYRLFPHLTVVDNVAFGPRVAGVGRLQARQLARHWLQLVDLLALADRRPGELSGGQAQRVALARALAAEPQVLLLDEPLAALDVRSRVEARMGLRRYLADFAGPVVVVTHDPVEAMVFADRIAVLEGGRIVQSGSPGEVSGRPVTDYVARLVGLNLFAGQAGAESGEVLLDGGETFPMGDQLQADQVEAGKPLWVAIPPSAITLHAKDPSGYPSAPLARLTWVGTVDGVEPSLDRMRVHTKGQRPALVDINLQPARDRSTATLMDVTRLRVGQQVWLSGAVSAAQVYPRSAP